MRYSSEEVYTVRGNSKDKTLRKGREESERALKSRSPKAGRSIAENTQSFQRGRMPASNREAKDNRLLLGFIRRRLVTSFIYN